MKTPEFDSFSPKFLYRADSPRPVEQDVAGRVNRLSTDLIGRELRNGEDRLLKDESIGKYQIAWESRNNILFSIAVVFYLFVATLFGWDGPEFNILFYNSKIENKIKQNLANKKPIDSLLEKRFPGIDDLRNKWDGIKGHASRKEQLAFYKKVQRECKAIASSKSEDLGKEYEIKRSEQETYLLNLSNEIAEELLSTKEKKYQSMQEFAKAMNDTTFNLDEPAILFRVYERLENQRNILEANTDIELAAFKENEFAAFKTILDKIHAFFDELGVLEKNLRDKAENRVILNSLKEELADLKSRKNELNNNLTRVNADRERLTQEFRNLDKKRVQLEEDKKNFLKINNDALHNLSEERQEFEKNLPQLIQERLKQENDASFLKLKERYESQKELIKTIEELEKKQRGVLGKLRGITEEEKLSLERAKAKIKGFKDLEEQFKSYDRIEARLDYFLRRKETFLEKKKDQDQLNKIDDFIFSETEALAEEAARLGNQEAPQRVDLWVQQQHVSFDQRQSTLKVEREEQEAQWVQRDSEIARKDSQLNERNGKLINRNIELLMASNKLDAEIQEKGKKISEISVINHQELTRFSELSILKRAFDSYLAREGNIDPLEHIDNVYQNEKGEIHKNITQVVGFLVTGMDLGKFQYNTLSA